MLPILQQAKHISKVGELNNYYLSPQNSLSPGVQCFVDSLTPILDTILSLSDIQQFLQDTHIPGDLVYSDGMRLSLCIGWKDTALLRSATNIILPGTDMHHNHSLQNNIAHHVVDPIAWASRSPSPDDDYGLLGKIPALRPSSDHYNAELHHKMLSTQVQTSKILGYALEYNDRENTLMPIIALQGGEDMITKFHQQIPQNVILTAKYFGLNR